LAYPIISYKTGTHYSMKQKILLVEDNCLLRENTTEMLELYNFTVLSASNGEEGLALAVKLTPDLILSDIKMPVMNGYHFLEHIRKEPSLSNTRFVFFTAACEKKEIDFGLTMGADDYILKPFTETDLLTKLKKHLLKL